MTMEQLGRLIREHWEQTSDTDPKHAAKEILGKLREHEWESTMLVLIAHAYSNQLSREGTRRRTRHNPAINPNRDQDEQAEARDLRPYFVPSQKNASNPGFVRWADMTAAFWEEWIARREEKAASLLANAAWGRKNVDALRKHRKLRCGLLPETVKEELFSELGVTDDEAAVAAE